MPIFLCETQKNHYSSRDLNNLFHGSDLQMTLIHSDKELDNFFEHANSIHPSIKFTHEASISKMSFLDTNTTSKEGNMTTDLYSKPTDKHQYISPSSCHLKHCLKSIQFNQAIRVKRICSTVETTKQRLGDLRHHLKRRGYAPFSDPTEICNLHVNTILSVNQIKQ